MRSSSDEIWIPADYFKALCKVRLAPVEHQVLYFIISQTWGHSRKSVKVSKRALCEDLGISRRTISRALKGLSQKNMVIREASGENAPCFYAIQEDYDRFV